MTEAVYRVALADGRFHLAIGTPEGGPAGLVEDLSLDELLAGPAAQFWERLMAAPRRELPEPARVVAPVQSQEVWAAGVTYAPSRDARQAESSYAAIYEAIYRAVRPELFYKSSGPRVRGPGEPVTIRSDSTWDVPVPASRDMSIQLVIRRGDHIGYQGEISASSMLRTFEDLADWLGRAVTFPVGAVLLTGTPLIPPPAFTLADGDLVSITIGGLGTLTNPVRKLDCGDPPASEAARAETST